MLKGYNLFMTIRIPPSLNWLVDKRARTHGEILRLKKEKREFLSYVDKHLNTLEKDLVALDRIFNLHEIKISPQIIPPNTGCRKENKLNYGELSQLIIEAIERAEDMEATAREIRIHVAVNASIKLNKEVPENTIVSSVKDRIKNLCRQGKLRRVPFEDKGPRRHYTL